MARVQKKDRNILADNFRKVWKFEEKQLMLILSFLVFPFIGLYTRFGMSAVLEVLLQVIIAFVAIFAGVILISSAISQRIHDYYGGAEVEKDEEEMEDEEDE